jgi:hypothetical protein
MSIVVGRKLPRASSGRSGAGGIANAAAVRSTIGRSITLAETGPFGIMMGESSAARMPRLRFVADQRDALCDHRGSG